MYKSIALLKCKAGLSREAFIEYYETRHVPLILSLVPGIREYRRNFIETEGAFVFPGASLPDFDVITELWFDDRAAYDLAMARIGEPAVWDRIAADEENFLDRQMTRMVVVDERASTLG